MTEAWKHVEKAKCPHGQNIPDELRSDKDHCEACGLKDDLRVCLTCGYMGCCESHQAHDTQHYRATGHPWIRPHRAAYDFLWCYACNAFLDAPSRG